jgi:hypothetical protein
MTAPTADAAPAPQAWELQMWDVLFLAVGLGFFGLFVAYAMACERL